MEKKMLQGKDSEAVQALNKLKGKETTAAWEVANAAEVLAQLHLQNVFGSSSVQGSSKGLKRNVARKKTPQFPKLQKHQAKQKKVQLSSRHPHAVCLSKLR